MKISKPISFRAYCEEQERERETSRLWWALKRDESTKIVLSQAAELNQIADSFESIINNPEAQMMELEGTELLISVNLSTRNCCKENRCTTRMAVTDKKARVPTLSFQNFRTPNMDNHLNWLLKNIFLASFVLSYVHTSQ